VFGYLVPTRAESAVGRAESQVGIVAIPLLRFGRHTVVASRAEASVPLSEQK
jgi:hypothetical protein